MTPEQEVKDLLNKLTHIDIALNYSGEEHKEAIKLITQALIKRENEVIERCAKIAENESELEDEMPSEFNQYSLEECMRAAVKVTAKSIAEAIRTLKTEGK